MANGKGFGQGPDGIVDMLVFYLVAMAVLGVVLCAVAVFV